MTQDPLALSRSMMAIVAQAPTMLATYRSDLAARGLGFTADDLAAISASAATHPLPPGHEPGAAPLPADVEAAKRVQAQVATTVWPGAGVAPDDPRLAPHGMSLVAYAVVARAVGWAGEDRVLVDRVLSALGHTRVQYDEALAWWTTQLTSDMVIATLYGQLFTQAGELPTR
ncbi:hypothetical protein [Nocardioides sp.]|uniref:hypothetical protein n=1 Tax=Nocardioides sp. TaxID=35761 RepID=UPI0031FE94F4|nr:hypothetical protein [Nocardioides sp.]